ncbi:RNA-directed DNA polymerase, eukaryota, reverse transcriptase zinc-binding domain protein [Tanacetum coccineum]
MCLSSWRRNTYVRAMIEVSADVELKESIVIAIPISNGKGHTLATVDIEYKWTPPRCSTCLIFYHVDDKCPKLPKVDAPAKTSDDEFVEVKKKKSKAKSSKPRQIEGIKLTKPALNLQYRKVEKGESFKASEQGGNTKKNDRGQNHKPNVESTNDVRLTNSFSSLGMVTDDETDWGMKPKGDDKVINERGSEEVDKLILEGPNRTSTTITGASTPTVECLCLHKVYVRDRPWCLLGDFNSAIFLEDSTAGSSCIDILMREFKDCVEEIEVMDAQSSGLQFTWSQKPKGKDGLLKKIDCIMANMEFNDVFVGAHAIFKPFKDVVRDGWEKQFSGFYMFRVVHRLKHMKKPLRKLLYEKGNLHVNVFRLRDELDRIQTDLDADPFKAMISLKVKANSVFALNESVITEERCYVKSRVSRSHIDVMTCADGTIVENENVAEAFVSHYEQFLGLPGTTSAFDMIDLFHTRLDEVHARDMVRIISRQEVKDALFSMGNEKSPGPDGYTTAFFKESWDIIADDLFDAEVFIGFGFHNRMIGWIMECVTTTSCSISINGSLHGFFKGKQGLRQGNPLSPYLFMLVMEILTLVLQRRVRDSMVFKYHRYCVDLELINLCFADELFLFVHGDVDSAILIRDALEEFKNVLGLTPSLLKSITYFCNALNHTKLSILNVLLFEKGRLPVKYLGVPLVTSRLIFRDCKELIERVQSRVQDWKNKSLSAAGRLQLVKSVIGSMHVYWASVFVLPSRVLLDIEQIMRGFLWCHGDMHKGKAKVACEIVCLSMDEGGLGVRRLDTFNKSLMVSHVWKLLSLKESLWRKVLQLRPLIRDFIGFSIGDGATASVWLDRWNEGGPLANTISTRDIFRSGLDLSTKVCDIVVNGVWNWPPYLSAKYHFLNSMAVPNIMVNTPDRLVWHNLLGVVKPFSVAQVWSHFKPLAGLSSTRPEITHIISTITPFATRRSSKSVIAKLAVAASAYFVWQERNNRLFKNNKRTVT